MLLECICDKHNTNLQVADDNIMQLVRYLLQLDVDGVTHFFPSLYHFMQPWK
jgi:hypothetical protein